MEPEVNEEQAELEALATDLQTCLQGQGNAAALRERTRMLARLSRPQKSKGQKVPPDISNAAVNALREAKLAYQRRSPFRIGALLHHGNLLDVFVGDRELGDWPFHHPDVIADEDARNWLDWLARPDCRAVIDEDLRQFVRVFFRTRRRSTWLPASRALARMATRDGEAAEEVRNLWKRWCPGAPPPSESPGSAVAPAPDSDAAIQAHLDQVNRSHLRRHVIHLACAWTAFSENAVDLDGFDPAFLAAYLVETRDAPDFSTALEGLLELVGANAFPSDAWQGPIDRISKSAQEAQTDNVLQRLHERLATRPDMAKVSAAVRERLMRPGWIPGPGGTKDDAIGNETHWETLWTWLDNARSFLNRSDTGAVAAMRKVATESGAGPAFDLAVNGVLPDGAGHALDAALPRLRALLDPDVWETTVGMRRTRLVVESWHLVHHPDIATLPWAAMAGRAIGASARLLEATDTLDMGLTVAEGWRSHMTMGMKQMGAGFFVRDGEFPEPIVSTMAAKGKGLEIQAAVQAERLLRTASNPEDRIRCLWRILRYDPVQRFFTQLETMVRWNDTALVRLVRAVGEMDARRDASRNRTTIQASEYPALAELYDKVARQVARILGPKSANSTRPAPSDWLAGICRTLKEAHPPGDPGCPAWDDWLRILLLGDDGIGGLCGWTDWLGQEWPAAAGPKADTALRLEVEQFLPRFKEVMARLRDERFQVSERDIGNARSNLEELDGFRSRLAWPEAAILGGVQMRLKTWLDLQEHRVEVSSRGEELGHMLRQLIAQGREDAVVELLEREDAALVDAIPDSARLEAHQFLLEKINLRASYRLRKRFSFDSRFKPFYAHFSPLLAGVLGGPILMLDFGTYWNEAFKNGAVFETVILTVAATLLAFLMMWGSLRPRRSRNGNPSKPACQGPASNAFARPGTGHLRLRAFSRLAALFLGAWVLAATSSSLLLLTLRNSDISAGLTPGQVVLQVFLWSGLSLFMGIFFQIVMEQRTATRDE